MNKADNVISEVAQNFRLNIGVEPQLVSGAFKATDSQLVGKITNKLDDIAKASKSHIDDVVGKSGLNSDYIDALLKNINHITPVDIPTIKSGYFEEFFNKLTYEQLEKIWQNKHLRRKIERQLRSPGGMHE